MATITFENGKKVNFEGTPTPQDVEEVAKSLGLTSPEETKPSNPFNPFTSTTEPINWATPPTAWPGTQLGKAVGTSISGLTQAIKQKSMQPIKEANRINNENFSKVAGDVARSVTLPASLAAGNPTSLLKTVGQYAGLGGIGAGGESLVRGNDAAQAVKDALYGAAISGGVGGAFNLLGKAAGWIAKKAGPSALSFTSGVPKNAIETAAVNPADAKVGLNMSVPEIRTKAVGALKELNTDLSKEFEQGLNEITKTSGQTKTGVTYDSKGFIKSASEAKRLLNQYARDFAREFRVGTRTSPGGIELDFNLSPIVKGGEKSNVQEAFRTISNWKDFSARGLQDLAERIGALRNFESGAKTESSAIISKIYNKIAGTGGAESHALIPTMYPDLAKLRTNFAQNKSILDEIDNVLGASKKDPTQIQGAVTRLDNLFKENKDVYVNAIRQLGKRSGIDFEALLAGGEFQKVLPDFIRGLGGGGTLAASAYFLNPWLLVLSPLFSPRGVGAIVRNAPAVAQGVQNSVSPLLRSGVTQSVQRTVPPTVLPQAK